MLKSINADSHLSKMEIVRGTQSLSGSHRLWKRPVLTIGNFDGVHLGHQAIIKLAVDQARARQGAAVAFTFRPHPQVALSPGADVQLLTTYDEKLDILGQLGLDAVIEEPFSRAFSTISPKDFFNEVILKRIGAEAVVVGYDFAFGRERQGHLEVLGNLCKEAGVTLTVVPAQKIALGSGTEVPSSSRIRRHLLAGEISEACELLGRNFSYRGFVAKGDGRGRKIGFPTANLKIDNKLTLPYGVYATIAVCDSLFPGKTFKSVTNVGVRPTFNHDPGLPALVETHILQSGPLDLYGRVLEVRFVRKLRDERKFAGVDSLKAQIALDSEAALRVLA